MFTTTRNVKMGKPKPPKPPDPQKVAAAQTGTNIGTAIANQTFGQTNQVTPYGTLNYDQTGTQQWTDPNSGTVYDLPQYTATQTLSPEQQQLLNTGQQTQQNLADLGQQQSGFLQDYMSKPFDGSNDATEARLMELGRKRIDPIMAEREDAMQQRLANQGITMGSKAYDTAMRQFNEGSNDAYNQLALTGNQQAFSQGQAIRNQPINEISALMSGSQVSQPGYVNTPGVQAPTTDIAGITQQGYNNQMGAYNQQMNARNEMMGGLFGLGAAGIMYSDRRVKENIKKVGSAKGNNLYEYSYKADPDKQRHIGLMAQEVEKKNPGAVINTSSGVKLVDYGKALETG